MSRPASLIQAHCIGPTNVRVTWNDSSYSCVDLAGWIASGGTNLAALKKPQRFATAQISENGSELAWGELRIEATHLLRIAAEQRAFSRTDLIAWQAEIRLSNQEAAEFLGVSLSAWNTYRAGTNPVPMPVGIVCRAALRDPILYQARYKPRTQGRPRKLKAFE